MMNLLARTRHSPMILAALVLFNLMRLVIVTSSDRSLPPFPGPSVG
jgi:hypothetical protein